MANRPYILNELTWKTVRDSRYEVAVLPWGATEAHNLHLPYSTDNIQVEAIAAHAAELETSVMRDLAPEYVRPLAEAGTGAARKFKISAFREGWAWAPRQWRQVTDDTGSGNPAAATLEKGRTYVTAVCDKIAGFLVELASADSSNMYE